MPNSFPGIPTQSKDHNVSDDSDSDHSDASGSFSNLEQHDTNPGPSNYLSSESQLAVFPPTAAHLTPLFTAPFTPPITRSRSLPGRVPAPPLQVENAELQARVTRLESRIEIAEAHAKLAFTEIHAIKRKLNAKSNKANKRRKLNVDARWLNSDEGLRMAQEQEAARVAEEERRRGMREQRSAKQAEREEQRRQRDPDAPFSGALATKTKADLQDIAQVLKLTLDGQRKDLLARINAHFDSQPHLREDPRFEGIFNRLHRRLRAAATPNDENHPPAPMTLIRAPVPPTMGISDSLLLPYH